MKPTELNELKDAMHAAVLRFVDMTDDDQVAELARAQTAVAALPATTSPALRAYYESTVAMLQTIHDMRPPVREAVAQALQDEYGVARRRGRGRV